MRKHFKPKWLNKNKPSSHHFGEVQRFYLSLYPVTFVLILTYFIQPQVAGWFNILFAILSIFLILSITRLASLALSLNRPPIAIVSVMVNGAMAIIFGFARIYWINGSTANFGSQLSRIDALYFTLGTFTTAGTGTLSPMSEAARLLVSIQYVLDVLFVGWIITVGVSRLNRE